MQKYMLTENDVMPDLDNSRAPPGILGSVRQAATSLWECVLERLRSVRPWSEFMDCSRLSLPTKAEVFGRVTRNLSAFRSNYIALLLVVSLYYLVTHLVFTVCMGACVLAWQWYRSRTEPCFMGNTEIGPVQAYAILTLVTLIVFYMTSGRDVMFWFVLIGSVDATKVDLHPTVAKNPMRSVQGRRS
eukprot:RCo000108